MYTRIRQSLILFIFNHSRHNTSSFCCVFFFLLPQLFHGHDVCIFPVYFLKHNLQLLMETRETTSKLLFTYPFYFTQRLLKFVFSNVTNKYFSEGLLICPRRCCKFSLPCVWSCDIPKKMSRQQWLALTQKYRLLLYSLFLIQSHHKITMKINNMFNLHHITYPHQQ